MATPTFSIETVGCCVYYYGVERSQTEDGVETNKAALVLLSVLIRVSSAKLRGVSECMKAISTLCGGSQMPLISSWRLIHSDSKEVWVIPLVSTCQPEQLPPRWQPAALLETLTLS